MPTAPLLIVNADDLGLSPGANLGICEAHQRGVVSSASLVVTTDSLPHALETCVRQCPTLGLGLHFCLSAGRPAAPVRAVPLLVDQHGFLAGRFASLAAALSRPGAQRTALQQQIEIELDAQLARLFSAGIVPDHMDSERHVHLIPAIFDLVVAAAQRHQIRFVRVVRDHGGRYFRARDLAASLQNGGWAKLLLLSALSARNRSRVQPPIQVTDGYVSLIYTGRMHLILERVLVNPPAGITEVAVHPGRPHLSRQVELGNAGLAQYLGSPDRELELQACLEAARAAGRKAVRFSDVAGPTRLGGDLAAQLQTGT